MSSSLYLVNHISPTVEEFVALHNKIGWGSLAHDIAQTSLDNSLFHVSVRFDNKLVGMGRVVGDGAMYFYIQDVIIDPDFQRQGIGQLVMEHIESYLLKTAQQGSTIGLLAAKGKEAFYTRFGYNKRDGDNLGLGMCKFI